jgi:deoxyribonuclease IV
MSARYIGAHMPTGKGLAAAVRAGAAIGCTAIQVFTSSPQQWKAKPVDLAQAAAFKEALAETGITKAVSHDSYLVNLAAPADELRDKSIAGLAAEAVRCGDYGIPLVVSHIGAHVGQGEDTGLARAAEGLLQVVAESPESVTVLAETTAGQGTVLNHRFESLARLIELCGGHSRVGVCLDTCHVFAAGYDVRTQADLAAMLDEFDRIVGLERLRAIHANDSKHPLGSRKDRHEHLGEGEIGPACFEALVNEPRLADVPIVVETPDADARHADNFVRLWSWASRG